ncbi:hypothetical protein HDU67_008617 [Dinochytrium kinnereticum]|nr:hypothetical protein HDU67_008617 [Dinochytrium kinnereticum]
MDSQPAPSQKKARPHRALSYPQSEASFTWKTSSILDIRPVKPPHPCTSRGLPGPAVTASRARRNISRATWMPLDNVLDRTSELPDRGKEFVVLASRGLNADGITPLQLVMTLKEKGWWKGLSFVPISRDNALNDRDIEWHPPLIYDDDEAFWAAAKECGRWDGHEPSLTEDPPTIPNHYSIDDAVGKHILFSPCPLLSEAIDLIEAALTTPPHPPRLRCLDMGCGAGRDLAFLTTRGDGEDWCWEVCGLDWMEGILDRARALFRNLGVRADRASALRAKFRLDGSLRAYDGGEHVVIPFGEGEVDLLLCVRFLARTHFRWMRRMVRRGGFVLIYTFFEGAQEFGAPKDPNHILKVGELLREFGGRDGGGESGVAWCDDPAVEDGSWEIVVDRVEHIPDGRPVQAFLARKK